MRIRLKTDGGPLPEIERPTEAGNPRTVPILITRKGDELREHAGARTPPDDEDYLGYYTYEWRETTAKWHPKDA